MQCLGENVLNIIYGLDTKFLRRFIRYFQGSLYKTNYF